MDPSVLRPSANAKRAPAKCGAAHIMCDIPPMPGGRLRAPLQCAFKSDPHARGRHTRPRQAWTEEALHQDPRLPDERVRLGQDGRRAQGLARDGADPGRGRSRRDPDQHLLDPREGAGKGVQPARPLEGAQEGGKPGADRRRRLRGLAGRRGHRQARAVCRPGVRPADPASPARADRRAARQRPSRRSTSASPRSRSSTRLPEPRAEGPTRVRVDHGRLLASTARYCVVPYTRGEEISAARSTTCWSKSRMLAEQGVREVNLLGQNVNAYRGADVRRRHRRPGRADPRHRPDRRHRPHPLHHLASAGVLRLADRGLRQRAASWPTTCTCRCSPAPTASSRDEARLHRAGVQAEDPQAARGAAGHLHLLAISSSASPARPTPISARP